MTPSSELRTERLILRPLGPDDVDDVAVLNADARVMEFFPGVLSRAESDAFLERVAAHWAAHGFGWWSLRSKSDEAFLGFAGLCRPNFEAPFTPCVEIGWRLGAAHWGQGYASEAAQIALRVGFEMIDLEEIVSFTARRNVRSQRLMERLGMLRDADGDFLHPKVPSGHPLQDHVLYRLTRDDFREQPRTLA
jgi:RimJ/RimL family protein N-acetyltransferase